MSAYIQEGYYYLEVGGTPLSECLIPSPIQERLYAALTGLSEYPPVLDRYASATQAYMAAVFIASISSGFTPRVAKHGTVSLH